MKDFEVKSSFWGNKYVLIGNSQRIQFEEHNFLDCLDSYNLQVKKWYGWETIATCRVHMFKNEDFKTLKNKLLMQVSREKEERLKIEERRLNPFKFNN